ncbi:MAG: response regulator transcription factor [Paludibacter sp.]|nr:response regulator transcription factor [Paludibacter sp.]
MNKIIIVDDHLLFREGIKLLIENEGFGQVIGEAENGLDFLVLLKTLKPDLVIMDIEMPYMNGLEATSIAVKSQPDLKVLVLRMMSEYVNLADIRIAGASGSIMKSAGKKELEKAFRAILNGEKYFLN